MTNHILSFAILAIVVLSILLKAVKLRRRGRNNTKLLMLSDLFLLIWITIPLLESYLNMITTRYFLILASLALAIPMMTLFFERELGVTKYRMVGALFGGGTMLIAYLEYLQSDEVQFLMYNVLISISLGLLIFRWIENLNSHELLSEFYNFGIQLNQNTRYILLGSTTLCVLIGLGISILSPTPSLSSIFYSLVFLIISISLLLDKIYSSGLNQRIFAIIYIIQDNIRCYVEYGPTKLLDVEKKPEIKDEFALALSGMSQMTSELTKSENKTAKLNYISSTDLFTEFYIIDESRYFVSIQDRKSVEILRQLVDLASVIDDNTENDEFVKHVNSILGIS